MKRLRYYLASIAWTLTAILVGELYWRISELDEWTQDRSEKAYTRYRRGGQ